MIVVDYQEKELLIPYCQPLVIQTDKKQKTLTIKLPEGYLDAMLS
jgi:ribosomal 30S subunit maturation factor RimM